MMTERKLIKWLGKKHKIGYLQAVEKLNSIRQANPALFPSLENGLLLESVSKE